MNQTIVCWCQRVMIFENEVKFTPLESAVDFLELQDKLQAAQARIDWLMLEYCPEEMTEEQLLNWAKHQVKA